MGLETVSMILLLWTTLLFMMTPKGELEDMILCDSVWTASVGVVALMVRVTLKPATYLIATCNL